MHGRCEALNTRCAVLELKTTSARDGFPPERKDSEDETDLVDTPTSDARFKRPPSGARPGTASDVGDVRTPDVPTPDARFKRLSPGARLGTASKLPRPYAPGAYPDPETDSGTREALDAVIVR